MKKKLKNKNRIFCYVCKDYIHVPGSDLKETLRRFHELGHDSRKVKTLERGLSGKPPERMG